MNLGLLGFPSPNVSGNNNTTITSSGDVLLRITTFNSSGNWTKQPDVKYVIVWLLGGGGGGGWARSKVDYGSAGGSGGGGGGCIKKIDATSLLAIEVVTIGAGGFGSTPPGTGLTGGTTSIGAHCSATGGQGGGSVDGFTMSTGFGPQGGVGVGGNINFMGCPGTAMTAFYASGSYGTPGGSGAYPLGGGGAVPMIGSVHRSNYDGANAIVNTGGGGGGAASRYGDGAVTRNGGSGGSDKCVVWEFG